MLREEHASLMAHQTIFSNAYSYQEKLSVFPGIDALGTESGLLMGICEIRWQPLIQQTHTFTHPASPDKGENCEKKDGKRQRTLFLFKHPTCMIKPVWVLFFILLVSTSAHKRRTSSKLIVVSRINYKM